MKTLIAFSSKHGCTVRCANMLEKHLDGEVDKLNLGINKNWPDNLEEYDKVILGSPIYEGSIVREVNQFSKDYLDELKQKGIGLFICGMREDRMEQQLDTNFPSELHETAIVREYFGGAFRFKTMNMLERSIVRYGAKVDKDVSAIREDKIQDFADKMNAS
ncbi:MAG: hypothetical protein JJU01_08465 [Alkalibacterium sp.]|nr:hypothetical protein [Alkalibacterium sp.]